MIAMYSWRDLDFRYSALDVAEKIVQGEVSCDDMKIKEAAYKLMLALSEMKRLTKHD